MIHGLWFCKRVKNAIITIISSDQTAFIMLEPFIEPNDTDIAKYISEFEQTRRQLDAQLLQQMMTRVSGKPAVMWGDQVIGFGQFTCVHKTGRQWDWPVISFLLEPGRISLYVMSGLDNYERQLKQLGKHKVASNCIHIFKLTEIDMTVLEKLMTQIYADMQAKYDCQ